MPPAEAHEFVRKFAALQHKFGAGNALTSVSIINCYMPKDKIVYHRNIKISILVD
jgi:hypothetical protein